MGSKKEVGLTQKVKVVPHIKKQCDEVVKSLNRLEQRLAQTFSDADKSSVMPHIKLQQAVYEYFNRASKEITISELKEANPKPYFHLPIQNFVAYLSRFGEVGFNHLNGFTGIYLGNSNNLVLIGILQQFPDRIEYSGYVPSKRKERSFHGTSVYNLGSPPLELAGVNFYYVNLVAEKKEKTYERADGFGKKGIKFP